MFKVGTWCKSIEDLLDTLKANGPWNTVSLRKGNRYIKYVNLPVAFDIETSSFYNGDDKHACMYIWQFGINGYAIHGRTWDEFLVVMAEVRDFFMLSESRRLPIYVHNLPYEFGWIKGLFNWMAIFAREERKPLRALTTEGFEFRDSLILAGAKLATVGKNLTKYKVQKLSGDLDYSLIRTPITPITQKELGYCLNDVLVVMAYIQEQIEMYHGVHKIPMTNTGRVRDYCRKECLSSPKYQQMIKELTLAPDEYEFIKDAFMGGFTHANYRNVGKVFSNVHSIDFTSSYPTVLISEDRYPMGKGEWIDLDDTNYNQWVDEHCLIFNVKFTNIVEKPMIPDHYISVSKCFELSGETEDNGRVISARELAITICDVDLEIINECYDYDSIEFGDCIAYKAGYLPTEFIKCVLNFYNDKTTLKDVAGQEAEYQIKKGMLNSCYGMIVTDICSDEVTYTFEWQTMPADVNEAIDRYNKDRKRFLFYPWGIFCTAFARRNLWYGILEMGQDQIYADTDSCKFINLDKHQQFIDDYNDWITERLENALDYHRLNHSLIRPLTVKGVQKPLGVWDYEGCYELFKTLGAKRYLVQKDGEIHCTIAGVNKKMTSEWLAEQDDPFGTFTDEMCVPADRAGRNIVSYYDGECSGTVVDYMGQSYDYHELSYIHMEQSEFNLSMSDKFLQLLGVGFVQTSI